MKRRAFVLRAVCRRLLALASAPRRGGPAYKNAALPVEARVADLLGRMTLEEKFWQLWMVPGDLDSNTKVYEHGVSGCRCVSTACRRRNAIPPRPRARMAEKLNSIQRFFVERTRLGIPIIPFEEAVHGLYGNGATMFPAAIGSPRRGTRR